MMVIEPKHVGAVLTEILIFFQSNSIVHQLINKRLWFTADIFRTLWIRTPG